MWLQMNERTREYCSCDPVKTYDNDLNKQLPSPNITLIERISGLVKTVLQSPPDVLQRETNCRPI